MAVKKSKVKERPVVLDGSGRVIPESRYPSWADQFKYETQGRVELDERLRGKFRVGDKVRIRHDITLQDVDNIRAMYSFRGKTATVTEIVFSLYVILDIDPRAPWIWWPSLLLPEHDDLRDARRAELELQQLPE